MFKTFTTALIFCFFLTLSSAQVEEEGVLVLNKFNFDSVIAQHPRILVMFYVPWCNHSKRLLPEFSKAANVLKREKINVPLAKLDSSLELDLSNQNGVQGFPTLKYFVDGVSIDYTGGRTDSEIIEWVSKRLGTFSKSFANLDELKVLVDKKKLVGVFIGPEASEEFKSFSRAAMGFSDIVFVNSESRSVKDFVGIQGSTGIALFKPFDEGKVIYSGMYNDKDILNFFDREEYPTVMYFDQKTADKVFGRNHETLFIVGIRGKTDSELASLREVSSRLKGKIELVYSYIDDNLGERLAQFFNLQSHQLPAARIVRFEAEETKQFKPVYPELTAENLYKFYLDFKSGRSKSSEKSEAVPKYNFGNIKIVVGKTFKDSVISEQRDVLMYFYAPWCGQCKTVEPILESLAAKNKGNKSLVFAKMDATANEVEGVAIGAFPTIRYYPAQDKANFIDFTGEKNEKNLAQFIKNPSVFSFATKIEL